jgi:hypothetical protein
MADRTLLLILRLLIQVSSSTFKVVEGHIIIPDKYKDAEAEVLSVEDDMDVDGEDDEHEKEGESHNTTVVKEGA